jgi:hypothetical protein
MEIILRLVIADYRGWSSYPSKGEQEVTVFQAARVDDHLWIRDVPIL